MDKQNLQTTNILSKPEEKDGEEKFDPISALYPVISPEKEEDIEREIEIFHWILGNENVEEAIK